MISVVLVTDFIYSLSIAFSFISGVSTSRDTDAKVQCISCVHHATLIRASIY